MSFKDREPDIDTPSFRMWVEKPGEDMPEADKGSVLTINYSAGEKVYEQRVYGGWKGYWLALISKTRPDGKIWVMIKFKRPDGETVSVGAQPKWLTKLEYHKVIMKLEASELSLLFDMQHPQITKGRAINIYMKGGEENGTK